MKAHEALENAVRVLREIDESLCKHPEPTITCNSMMHDDIRSAIAMADATVGDTQGNNTLKAWEALKIAEAANLRRLPELRKLIDEASHTGKKHINISGGMTAEEKSALERDGYRVTSYEDPRDGNGGGNFKIDWSAEPSHCTGQSLHFPPGVR